MLVVVLYKENISVVHRVCGGTFNFTNTSLAIGASNEVVLYWRWAFYDDANQDKADTLVGFAAAGATDDADKSITIKADLNFTQVD